MAESHQLKRARLLMSDDQRDVLLGWAFGDTLPGTSGVMVSMLVRTWEDGHAVEGIRDPLLIDREILESLGDSLLQISDLMKSRGMVSSGPEPARSPLQWNAGIRFDRRIAAYLHMCTMFGFYDPDPIHGAAIARIETKYVRDKSSEPEAADYLVPYQSIQEMRESLGSFLRDSRDGTEMSTGSDAALPQFDFGQLKLRYDARMRKVRMNRAYLGEYLRGIGVMSLPGQSDLVDLLAKLYLLNRKQGMAAIADVEIGRAHV